MDRSSSDADATRSRRATITDVAQLAGVSRSAVSRVFNAQGGISAATEERIRDAARKLHWTPSATAIALRSARSRTVGLVLNRPGVAKDGDPELPSGMFTGLEKVLARHDFGLLLHIATSAEHEEQTYRRLAEARRVDGVVLLESRVGDTRFELVRRLGLPAVLLGTPWVEDPISYIGHGPRGAGMREVAEHLLELGHRSIAAVSGPEDYVESSHRDRILREVLATGGAGLVAHHPGPYTPVTAAERTRAILEQHPEITAIVYATDEMAIAGMATLREHGLRIPEDVSVVGYNGTDIGAWYSPALTTVRRDVSQRGRAAARTLLGLMGVTVEASDEQVVDPELVIRASTAPPRGAATATATATAG
ncbi:LacI family DNA-binding transcriptional regulator [Occultella aeris]|uniref:HTH-type transcriptional repressor CytR n=1 Tax=Occultella aeris TaxID=2761496 RepID=A0A7M4DMG5_9MICO|nr:LacI family DNA-binding transcriptional regulator [Occultella aeris]VZO38575.1 HTH-type transcriptional repressor CytR [Occultella aeris]